MRGSGMTGDGEHGSREWSGVGHEVWAIFSMETPRDGKGVAIGVEPWRAGRLRALGTGSVES